LSESSLEEYVAAEVAAARRAGASEENLPFLTVPAGSRAAVLLVHGFSATPWEVHPLAAALTPHGLACLAVRLPGHGTTPEDLATRLWEEWLAVVVAGYDRLSPHFARIYVVGLSTGSLLALLLADQRPVAGLVLLSPYLRLRHRLAPFAGWLRHLKPYQTRALGDVAAAHYYTRRPLAGVHQINRLLRRLSGRLAGIEAPVLALHGGGDDVVDIDSGRVLVERLGSCVKHYRRFGPEAPHVLTAPRNPCQQEVLEMVGSFLAGLEAQAVEASRC